MHVDAGWQMRVLLVLAVVAAAGCGQPVGPAGEGEGEGEGERALFNCTSTWLCPQGDTESNTELVCALDREHAEAFPGSFPLPGPTKPAKCNGATNESGACAIVGGAAPCECQPGGAICAP